MTAPSSESPELVAIARRWNEAMRTGRKETVSNLLSTSEALRYVGTDADEIWRGEPLRRGFPDHTAELPVYRMNETFCEAFEIGEVGWALWIGQLLIEGVSAPQDIRLTYVFALEEGAWKLIQMHSSFPVSNVETHGHEHTAINSLVAAAASGFDLEQREGLATILFTDVVGSSALASALGDRLWAPRISAHFALVEQTVTEKGGAMVKSLGDGTMSSFSSTRAALAAAQTLQRAVGEDAAEPALAIRIGLHCGDVIQTKDDFFGNVVNKAARITALAGAGEIRVSDAVRVLAAGDAAFDFDMPRIVRLKGFDGDDLTHRLDWSAD